MAFGYQVLGFGSAPTAAAVEFLWGGDRAVVVGGYYGLAGLAYVDEMEYFAISSAGDAVDFGDLGNPRGYLGAFSNGTRGVAGGGVQGESQTDIIEYWTFASLGNSIDFGDLSAIRTYMQGTGGNGTRGIWAGGGTPYYTYDIIEYVNIASIGDATDFGNVTSTRRHMGGCNSDTRMLICGGNST